VSRGPAADLARIKRAYPFWSIRRVEYGEGFTAQRGGPPSIYGRTLAELADRLHEEESRRRG
jgi:hypothetical protein